MTGPASGKVSSVLSHVSVMFFQAVRQYQKIEVIMSTKQYGMKASLKVFDDRGLDAVSSEIKDNLHGRGHSSHMEGITFISRVPQEKEEWQNQGAQMCGRPQTTRIYYQDGIIVAYCFYPALMATCLIDAIEGQFVATINIPGTFLQANMDNEVWIKFKNEMIEVLFDIDPERYGPCVCECKG